MKDIFKKNVDVDETKEVTDMEVGFFEKHKKGVLIGVIALVTAIAAGIMVACFGDDDDDAENEEDDIFDVDCEVVNEETANE